MYNSRPNNSSRGGNFSRPAQGGYGGARPSFGSRPSYGSRPTSRFAPRGGSRRGQTSFNDVSRFVNKVIVTEEAEVFVPEHAFSDFAVHDALKAIILKKGYTTPTPIQDKSIPHILAGQDVVGIANTGTGKTAAFLIPLIHKVMMGIMAKQNEQVLIVAPTRELAIQIDAEFNKFTDGLNLYSVCVVGGAPINKQIRELRAHNDFIIGTPGRIKDLMEQGYINLSKFNTIVLDEADRMLDMGFVADMRFMMAKMPQVRHTLFFSATLSKEIEQLIGEFLNNPVRVSVKTRDTSKNIDQDVVRTLSLIHI